MNRYKRERLIANSYATDSTIILPSHIIINNIVNDEGSI